jgi:predicted NUDIX family NTP pyrophosphohydrolase
MKRHSAGLLVYREGLDGLELFLAHPGGPFYLDNDNCWGIPKGEFDPTQESALQAALREFHEETSVFLGDQFPAFPLPVQKGKNKYIHAFATSVDNLPEGASQRLNTLYRLRSNHCEIEYMGGLITIPEVDNYAWFPWDTAIQRMTTSQKALVFLLTDILDQPEEVIE